MKTSSSFLGIGAALLLNTTACSDRAPSASPAGEFSPATQLSPAAQPAESGGGIVLDNRNDILIADGNDGKIDVIAPPYVYVLGYPTGKMLERLGPRHEGYADPVAAVDGPNAVP